LEDKARLLDLPERDILHPTSRAEILVGAREEASPRSFRCPEIIPGEYVLAVDEEADLAPPPGGDVRLTLGMSSFAVCVFLMAE
jgi:hypothetical protein